jgi:hypothetical protein
MISVLMDLDYRSGLCFPELDPGYKGREQALLLHNQGFNTFIAIVYLESELGAFIFNY